MADSPLALHFTFGTKGMRLHGDPRGTVCRAMNKPGDPIIGTDEQWERCEYDNLKFPPIVLAFPQRVFAESIIPAICDRGGWRLHICAVKPDHVHTLLTADVTRGDDGTAVRKWFKRWLGEALSAKWPLTKGDRWFAVGGSVKWIWTNDYFANVHGYILKQRATRTQ